MVVNGDSGAWVFREEELLGMIIAGGGLFPWAYMLPIKSILNDVEETLKTKTIIPSAAQIQQIIQEGNCKNPIHFRLEHERVLGNYPLQNGIDRSPVPPIISHEDDISSIPRDYVQTGLDTQTDPALSTLPSGGLPHRNNSVYEFPIDRSSDDIKDEKGNIKTNSGDLRIVGILSDSIKVVQLTPHLTRSLSQPKSNNTDTFSFTIDIRRFDLWCKVFKKKLDAGANNVLLPELGELLEIILINAAREFKAIESILEMRLHVSRFILSFLTKTHR